MARLSGRYECHRLTLAGFAGVPPRDGEVLSAARRELAAYIRREGLERPVVVGHSLGGFLALWLAATEPGLVGPVVSVDGLPALGWLGDESVTAEEVARRAAAMAGSFATMTPERFAAATRASLATMIGDPAERERIAAAAVPSDPATVARAMRELLTNDIRPLLPRIEAPVLLLAAGGGRPAEAAAELAARYERQVAGVPRHRVVSFPAARHFLMLDEPDAFLAAVEEFLAEAGR